MEENFLFFQVGGGKMGEYLKINDAVVERFNQWCNVNYPNQKTDHYCEYHSWFSSRYLQLTCSFTSDLNVAHYEYKEGYVELHFELEADDKDYIKDVRDKLIEKTFGNPLISWHRWFGRRQGRCRYKCFIETEDQLYKTLSQLIKIVEDCLVKPHEDYQEPQVRISKIWQLPFAHFSIPFYQRPYKWQPKHVRQLIQDIKEFSRKSSYRLGSLVFYNSQDQYEIVDGQQRIVTIFLILERAREFLSENYKDLYESLDGFKKRNRFTDPVSHEHFIENWQIIREEIPINNSDEFTQFYDFLINQCEFVQITLSDLAEAFQFFDSQNARGKDLEPHDLLKSYHLRAIERFKPRDLANIKHWEKERTESLERLFLATFRVKSWTKGLNARIFTKDDIGIFKGISAKSGKRYPAYLQTLICHFFADTYTDSPTRYIDGSQMGFPFQLDQICVNGERFFDMMRHYDELYDSIRDANYFSKKLYPVAHEIINLLNIYDKRWRIGDRYVRDLFDAALLYYMDKFGFEEIDKAVKNIFLLAYQLRLKNYRVQLATIDSKALDNSLFASIRNAFSPKDFINIAVPKVLDTEIQENAGKAIAEQFERYGYIIKQK